MEEHFGFAPDSTKRGNVKGGKFSDSFHFKRKSPKDQEKKTVMRKELKKKKQEKKKRIVIRNLSFLVKEEKLKEIFLKFGEIVDVNIPRKPDGKNKGFAFIQYENFQSAVNAIKNLNYQQIEGRPIAVDYAIAKDKYQHIMSSKQTTNHDMKSKEISNEQTNEDDESEVEKEDSDGDSQRDIEDDVNKSVSDADEEHDNDHVKEFLKKFDADRESLQDNSDGEPEEDNNSVSGSSSESDDESELGEHNSEADKEPKSSEKRKIARSSSQEPLHKKKKYVSHDVNEGKTVFIRNVPFEADQDALKRTMEEFGPLEYCLLCIDQFTELSKGTAFVKFTNKEDADKVIEKSPDTDAEGIYLDGRKLSCSLALSPEELESQKSSDVKTGKDKRNLYLLKEGLIRSGSAESEGVSQTDMAKRANLEVTKRNKLKNFQFFVSDKRLCVHNIPPNYTDAKLRKLFKSTAGRGANVTEAKIMKDLRKINPQGIAKSKGYGFVAFDKHEHALKALMEINNNPGVFTSEKRPIVEFSVENRSALLSKQRSREKSRMNLKKMLENSEGNHSEEDLSSFKFGKKQNNKNSDQTEIVQMLRVHKNMGKTLKSKKKKNKLNRQTQFMAEDESTATDRSNRFSEERPQKKKNGRNRSSVPRKQIKEASAKDNNNNSNMSPVKKSQKKKKNKQQKMKGTAFQETNSNSFSQMVNKYKEKLLTQMQ